MKKHDVLAATTFGHRIAEEEAEALVAYFVETEHWRKVMNGEVDVVYGPKGSGKSALYSLLRSKRDDLSAQGIIAVSGEKIRGTPVFETLVTDPPASEEQFKGLWKFYFLSLIGSAFKELKIQNEYSTRLISVLEEAELVPAVWSIAKSLRAALDYVRRIDSVSGEVKVNPQTGIPEGIGGKVTLREPGSERRKLGYVSVDTLLETGDSALAEDGSHLWIILDRLDVAFSDSPELEENALRALFRVYLDMAGLVNISLKIFLRDDIWRRITTSGFREASHITRSMTINWDSGSLLNLVIRRALHNQAIREFYNVEPSIVLASWDEQEKLFYRIFPRQVILGEKKLNTLDWLLSRTMDGTGQTTPRELIHLLSAARDQQIRLLEMGQVEPEEETLIDRIALRAALPEVSRARFEQTLCAEHPALKPMLEKLEGEKTQQSPATLAKIWRVTEPEAIKRAEMLADVGFFEKRGTKEQPQFWVPFLYRDALHMLQGQAD
jgi:hypothetical protein